MSQNIGETVEHLEFYKAASEKLLMHRLLYFWAIKFLPLAVFFGIVPLCHFSWIPISLIVVMEFMFLFLIFNEVNNLEFFIHEINIRKAKSSWKVLRRIIEVFLCLALLAVTVSVFVVLGMISKIPCAN